MSRRPGDRGRSALFAAALLGVACLLLRWPGVAMFDSIAQYGQAVSGRYEDWHPPAMALAWGVLGRLYPGTAPMLVAQLLGWWGGLGLLAAALARAGRGRAAAAVLVVGACPLWLGWATVVLKDAQMAAALLLATGLVAHWRLAGERLPRTAVAAVAALIGYATLVRGNAVFATAPLVLALAGWAGLRVPAARAALLAGVVLATLLLAPLVNRGLIGARDSGVQHALPLYDLAGIAVRGQLPAPPGATPAAWGRAVAAGCYTSYFWNPFGEASQCGAVGRTIAFDAPAADHVARAWAAAILAHPLAYAAHRLAHLNQNWRLWVGAPEPDVVPPVASEANALGLGAPPSRGGRALVMAARWATRTPLGWPCVWTALAAGLLWASRGAAGDARLMLGRALAGSALVMDASFAVVSIASDLRYHLWSMIATALAAVLIADARAWRPRRMRTMLAAVALVAAVAGAGRLAAPRARIPGAVAAVASLPPPARFPTSSTRSVSSSRTRSGIQLPSPHR